MFRGRPAAQPGSRRRAIAAALSLFVHAGLGALLVTRPPRAARDLPPPAPVELEIWEAPAARPDIEIARPTNPHPGKPPPGRGGHPSARAQVPEPAPPIVDDASVVTPAPPARRGPVDLSLGALSADARARIGGPVPDVAPPPSPRGRPSVDELRVTVERAEDAVANVDRGRVDPLLYDILRGARKRFADEARHRAEAIALGPGKTLDSWGRGLTRRVETAKTEDPSASQTGDAALGPKLDPYVSPRFLESYDEWHRQAAAGAEERRAEVCLRLSPGRAPEPSLRRASGDAALDRLALDSFTHAAEARDVPTDVRPEVACFELRISATRMPPVPFVSCGFDLDGVSCAWPFKKVTDVAGHLLSVDYGEAPRASLLRRAR